MTNRSAYPTGPVPAELRDDTVAIQVAGMTFTIGDLRHAGMTATEISREIAAASAL